MKSVDQYPHAYRSFQQTDSETLVCLTCGAYVPVFAGGTHKEWHDNLHYSVQTIAELVSASYLIKYTSTL